MYWEIYTEPLCHGTREVKLLMAISEFVMTYFPPSFSRIGKAFEITRK
jgi:hypothetical protein